MSMVIRLIRATSFPLLALLYHFGARSAMAVVKVAEIWYTDIATGGHEDGGEAVVRFNIGH